jgi:hypothetical protein
MAGLVPATHVFSFRLTQIIHAGDRLGAPMLVILLRTEK